MRFFLSKPLTAAQKVSRVRPEDYLLTIICVIRARLVVDGRCQILSAKEQPGLQKAETFDDGLGNSPRYGGDFAPYKPRTDVTLMGHGYCPGGRRGTKLRVTFGVDQWRKSLDLVGNQHFIRSGEVQLSPPEPFSAMALRMENAFGGLDSPFNPWGKGYGKFDTKLGSTIETCNIHPAGADHVKWDAQIPASGYGPLPANRPPRSLLRGTYDKAWLYKRSPLPPENFDWSFYNVAPADQQFSPYLTSNETLYFENLHPKTPIFASQLPGLRQRVLIRRIIDGSDEPQIEEAHAVMDSVHIDTDMMTVDLAWRAVASTPYKDARDVTHCYIASEPVEEEPQPQADHVSAFMAQLNPPPFKPVPLPSAPPPTEEELAADELEQLITLKNAVSGLPFSPSFKDAVEDAKTSAEIKTLIEAETKRAMEFLEKAKKAAPSK